MRSRTLIALSVLAVGAFMLLEAGWSGGASPPAAAKTGNGGVVVYSQCMRSHGVSNFPQPDGSGGIPKQKVVPLVSRPQFQAAQTACEHLMPKSGLGPQETAQQMRTRLTDALSFAACMRSHGVTSFPDPDAQGNLSVEMVQAQGIDVHSPVVLRTALACLPASHGWLTPAKITAALNKAGG